MRTLKDKSPRILVVDDDRDATETFLLHLSLWGYMAAGAHSGPAALELALSFRPDVVLLDVVMPGMGGHELAQRMRATAGLRRAVLVAVSGAAPVDPDPDPDRPFDHFLQKPVD